MTRQDSDVDQPNDRLPNDRYASIELDGGSVLVYDTDGTTRWVQSDTAVSLEGMR